MKQKRGKTEIRMFSNGRAKILGRESDNSMHSFWVRVFSDFYKDYEESLRLKYPRKNYFSKYEKVSDRLNITEAGSQKLERAGKRAGAIFRRMGRLLQRSLIPFKNLQVFDATGSPQRSLMAIISYVRAAYESIYDMVEDEGVPDPHPVALAAAKVACNFIITIKTAVIISSLSDEKAIAASDEAGLNQINEGAPIEGEENLPADVSMQLSSLIAKYRAAYKMLGITSIIPTVTQQIRRIVLATLATQYPGSGIPDSVYALGSFAYNEVIGKLVEHILQDKIQAYQSREGQREQAVQQGAVMQSKKPKAGTLMNEPEEDNFAYDLDEEDAIFEGVEDVSFEEDDEEADVMALSPVKDDDEMDSEFIEPQDLDDDEYDDDDEDDYDEYEDDDEYDENDEVSETRLEQAIADIQVSPQSKRLAQKFAAENPEGFDSHDELKRKLYSFLIKNLFRYRYFSDEKAEDEAKEHVADIIDRLESIEEKIGSLEEAVEKVVEASTAVVENTEDSEEENEKFDLFLEKSKEEEEEESDSQEESEEEEEEGTEEEEKEEEEEGEEEEEKSQSKRSNRYSEIKKQKRYKDITEKKKTGKKLFSYDEMDEMDEMEINKTKRYSGDMIEAKSKKAKRYLEDNEKDAVEKFRKIFSDEEDRERENRYEEFFSKKLRQKKMRHKLASDKDAHYGRKSKKHKDIDVVSIIHKLQKPKRRSPRR